MYLCLECVGFHRGVQDFNSQPTYLFTICMFQFSFLWVTFTRKRSFVNEEIIEKKKLFLMWKEFLHNGFIYLSSWMNRELINKYILTGREYLGKQQDTSLRSLTLTMECWLVRLLSFRSYGNNRSYEEGCFLRCLCWLLLSLGCSFRCLCWLPLSLCWLPTYLQS